MDTPSPSSQTPDDASIVAGLRSGDPRAFEAMVRAHVGPLRAVALRLLRNEEDADDAVQEAFLNAYRSLDRFRGDARLGTWLHRIVVNVALGRLRKRESAKRDGEQVQIDAHLPQFHENGMSQRFHQRWTVGADELVSRAETREVVRNTIDKVPEPYRTVLVLRDIEELDTAETAELLGIKPGTVKVRLHRARQALRNLLERELELTGEA